jgi:hypothetical protein
MYIRTTARRNRDGSIVRYLQLAHNERDPQTGMSRARVLYNFGREDAVDREALARLVRSISRFLSPEDALHAQATSGGPSALRFVESRPLGGAWVLEHLWQRVGIQAAIVKLLRTRKYALPVERALFALVANRALAPMSKSACERWVSEEVVIPELPQVAVHHLYRAMDFLLEAAEEVQREVFFATSDLLNLEVDLLYFDTTSTYFEVEEEDAEDAARPGWRKRGYSRDHRPDLPQVVIGLAVTREGIPIRCWCWPGNTPDATVIEEVKRDLVGWKLGRVITVVDTGFTSTENLRTLQRTGGHYIAGEKLRGGKAAAAEALRRPGRYQVVRDNLEVKEIVVGAGEARVRYILVRNPQEAERDRRQREEALRRLREALAALPAGPSQEHTRAACALLSHPTYRRYLRTDKHGWPQIDPDKVRDEARLDGKYLVRTSDDTLPPEDVALGYKQLIEVEDAFRTLKHTLDLRPVYHRVEERIRAHVLLCWLALLLVRIIERRTDQRWPQIRRTLQRMHLGEFAGPEGAVWQRTETTADQHRLLTALRIPEPPRIFAITPARTRARAL